LAIPVVLIDDDLVLQQKINHLAGKITANSGGNRHLKTKSPARQPAVTGRPAETVNRRSVIFRDGVQHNM
jgi:hypothetical protein